MQPLSVIVDTAHSPHALLKPVPISAVRLQDTFWQPRRDINRQQTLPSQLQQCEETGRLDNFRIAAGRKEGKFEGIYFNDSDVYKWLEAAAWTLATDPDPQFAAQVDEVIAIIAAAQQPDGYLNTYFMFEREAQRWTNLRDMHELYCAGHFLQAAVAHYRATAKTNALEIATRLADCICNVFGDGENQKRQTDGHEEIEMALVELSRATGQSKYFDQAQFFLNVRGQGTIGGGNYHQDHQPFREQSRMTGHAVRHVYLNCGAADALLETGDSATRHALDCLWDNMTQTQMYISGGIGSRYEGEAFGDDYELPNARAYTETCAAIGSVMWNWRMLQLEGDARYANLLELTLYNGVLAGLSLDGAEYFYQNPLQDNGKHRRQKWFGCACCPPNIARLLAQLPGYFYSVCPNAIWAHLYAQSEADISLPDGRTIKLKQTTNYPFDNKIVFEVDGEGNFTMMLRHPQHSETSRFAVTINGETYDAAIEKGYLKIERLWQRGDTIQLAWPMESQLFVAHPHALENNGRAALMLGPLLYCFEGTDHPELDLRDIIVSQSLQWKKQQRDDFLRGAMTLHTTAKYFDGNALWPHKDRLYQQSELAQQNLPEREVSITAIPYYAWANREAGALQVWLRLE